MLALLLSAAAGARAQSAPGGHRFEGGAFLAAVNLDGFGEAVTGVGGRLAYNFNENLALDAEASFFPETRLGNDQSGQKAQTFVGVRAGGRSKHVGLFAKVRPGVMSIGEVTSGFDCDRGQSFTVCRPRHNHFALDAGGVLEFYPSSRAIIRLDAGDTIIRLRSAGRGVFGGGAATADFTHNFQVSVGFGYRF